MANHGHIKGVNISEEEKKSFTLKGSEKVGHSSGAGFSLHGNESKKSADPQIMINGVKNDESQQSHFFRKGGALD